MLRFCNKTTSTVPVTPGGMPGVVVKAVTKTPASNEDPLHYTRFAAVGAETSYPVYFGGAGGVVIIVAEADATAVFTVVGGYIPDTTAGGTVLGTVTNPKLAVAASQHITVPTGVEWVWVSHAGISAGGPCRAMWSPAHQATNG